MMASTYAGMILITIRYGSIVTVTSGEYIDRQINTKEHNPKGGKEKGGNTGWRIYTKGNRGKAMYCKLMEK
jgi:hypothetical protein